MSDLGHCGSKYVVRRLWCRGILSELFVTVLSSGFAVFPSADQREDKCGRVGGVMRAAPGCSWELCCTETCLKGAARFKQ